MLGTVLYSVGWQGLSDGVIFKRDQMGTGE